MSRDQPCVSFAKYLASDQSQTDEFLYTFGEELFSLHQVGRRIDFLYEGCHKYRDEQIFKQHVYFGNMDGVQYLKKIEEGFGIVLLRGLDSGCTFAIRLFETQSCKCNCNKAHHSLEDVIGETNHVTHNHIVHDESDVQSKYRFSTPYNYLFWNFATEDAQSRICHPSEGFLDIHATQQICYLLRWSTNMMGFQLDRVPNQIVAAR